MSAGYLGDFPVNGIVDFKWSTFDAAGASVTRATNGTVEVYVGNGTTQLTAGVTDTEDHDGVTGRHHCRVDLSADAAYAAGSECQVVLTGAVIDGQTVNVELAHFSIERAGAALALLKGANGLAAIKSQTAAIETDTQDIQGRLPSALVSGRIDANLAAAGLQSDAVSEIQSGLATASALQTVDDVVDRLERGKIYFEVQLGTTDTIILTDLTGYASLAGRSLIFDEDDPKGQGKRIASSSSGGASITLDSALDEAPAPGTRGVIV